MCLYTNHYTLVMLANMHHNAKHTGYQSREVRNDLIALLARTPGLAVAPILSGEIVTTGTSV